MELPNWHPVFRDRLDRTALTLTGALIALVVGFVRWPAALVQAAQISSI